VGQPFPYFDTVARAFPDEPSFHPSLFLISAVAVVFHGLSFFGFLSIGCVCLVGEWGIALHHHRGHGAALVCGGRKSTVLRPVHGVALDLFFSVRPCVN